MPTARRWFLSSPVALRKESVDRNTRLGVQATAKVVSLSARRAWIEMRMNNYSASTRSVALRKESVDRNVNAVMPAAAAPVALRKESVDRNASRSGRMGVACMVALRKESVDRNASDTRYQRYGWLSLSARRAWIEISNPANGQLPLQGRSPQGERG